MKYLEKMPDGTTEDKLLPSGQIKDGLKPFLLIFSESTPVMLHSALTTLH